MSEGVVREDWFGRLAQPRMQGMIALGFMAVFFVFGLASAATGNEVNDRWGYQSAATAMMLFGVGNALMSLSTDNVGKYWSRSFVIYVAVGAIGVLAAWATSGVWLSDAGSYRWIFIVLTFGYLVLLSIVSLMRGIVNFAEREEWTQPRQRD